ncbi:MAG TPA: hypothetical protein DCR93_03555 [Cytophagales bacterium]|nr:hypothetical protein [Cytophagales bacterium]
MQKNFAQTDLSGVITRDSVLTLAGSPYTITKQFLVTNGATLTVEPGVVIQGITTEPLIVDGYVEMNGTETDSIFLEGVALFLWNHSLDSSHFRYLSLHNAKIRHWEERNNPQSASGTLRIAHTTFESSGIIFVNNRVQLEVDSCRFLGGQSAITSAKQLVFKNSYIRNGLRILVPCTFDRCTFSGAEIDAYHDKMTIQDCHFMSSSAYTGPGSTITQSTWEGSRVLLNTGTISDCHFYNTPEHQWDGAMLTLREKSSATRCLFENPYNTGEAILANFGAQVDSCTILGFKFSIQAIGTAIRISHSNLVYAERWSIYQRGSAEIDARGNYWGTTDSVAIAETIYDFYDKWVYGPVVFENFLTEPTSFFPDDYQLPVEPIAPPQDLYKGYQNEQVTLVWQPSPSEETVGYNIYEEAGNVYRLIEAVGRVGSYQHQSLRLDKDYVITAVQQDADGNLDQSEGYESLYTDVALLPYTGNISISRNEYFACHVVTASVDISPAAPLTQETFRVELLRRDDELGAPGVLGTLRAGGASDPLLLPDTLTPGATYQIRVVASTFNLYVETVEFEQIDLRNARLTVDNSETQIGGTSIITYEGPQIPEGDFHWHFAEHTVGSGQEWYNEPDYAAFTVLSGEGLGPYTVRWDKSGTMDNYLYIYFNKRCFTDLYVEVLVAEENAVTSLEDSPDSWMSVYPTQVHDAVQLRPGSSAPYTYRLLSTAGQEVLAGDLIGQAALNLGNLPRGYYLLQVTYYQDQVETHKIYKE